MANRLQYSSSPYLLQHANNPVDWYTWGAEAFEKAELENKPLLISIGYAACHWCHVMERESFEDEVVAQIMNQYFVCIKVDREEHPQVDHFYMDSIVAMTGSGGWPLNVFATPKRVPFYGGTYFPPKAIYQRASWTEVLESVHQFWLQNPNEVKQQADLMINHLQSLSQIGKASAGEAIKKSELPLITQALLSNADLDFGGFGDAPKFPNTFNIRFLLEQFPSDKEGAQHAFFSLDKLLESGIYDFLGGGLCRYATDREWMIPHFEKMLYDQALFLEALATAYQYSQQDKYAVAIREVIGFCERELKGLHGLFYCALDADSESVEGKFYTWTYEEWRSISDGKLAIAETYFNFRPEGNWEGVNIIHRTKEIPELGRIFGKPENEIMAEINLAKQLLLEKRNERIRPQTDDKCLLSWNALMNAALFRCGEILNDNSIIEGATKHFVDLIRLMKVDNNYYHSYKGDKSTIGCTLEDLAYLLRATIKNAVHSGAEAWYGEAEGLMHHIVAEYSDEHNLYFYFTSQSESDVPVRKIDINDTALPSVNAIMAENLMWLGMLLGESNWVERSRSMVFRLKTALLKHPHAFGCWCLQSAYHAQEPAILMVENEDDKKAAQLVLPNSIWVTTATQLPKSYLLQQPPTVEKGFRLCTSSACIPEMKSLKEVELSYNKL